MVFRADATPEIGAGHVMRLSAIAEEAIRRGFECIFVGCISDIDWLDYRIKNLGFKQVLKPESIFATAGHQNVLLIDSYHIPADDPSINTKIWKLVVSVRDLQTPAYDSNLTIVPSMEGLGSNYVSSNFLFGPEYIPFRKSISRSRRIEDSDNLRLLVFGGGTDFFGMAPKVAGLIRQKYEFKKVNFIYHNRLEIESMDTRFKVFPFGPVLDSLVDTSDVVITSASTSSFEILARGIPTGIIRLVGNQDSNFEALDEAGLASQIGKRSDDGVWNFSLTGLGRLMQDAFYRRALRERNLKVFDFDGSSRIINKIIELCEDA